DLQGVARELGLEDLDRHPLADQRLNRLIDDAHAALADGALHLVLADGRVDQRVARRNRSAVARAAEHVWRDLEAARRARAADALKRVSQTERTLTQEVRGATRRC